MRDWNIPTLNAACGCNCASNEALADLVVAGQKIWAAEIAEIESHGYKQTPKVGYMPKDAALDDVIRRARLRSYADHEKVELKRRKVVQRCHQFDHWGVLVVDDWNHMLGFAERQEDRRAFNTILKMRDKARGRR